MVSSVSSKYLDYNPHGSRSDIRDGQTLSGEGKFKIGNFNEYQHVYNDVSSNDANVQWITKLRESDSRSMAQST